MASLGSLQSASRLLQLTGVLASLLVFRAAAAPAEKPNKNIFDFGRTGTPSTAPTQETLPNTSNRPDAQTNAPKPAVIAQALSPIPSAEKQKQADGLIHDLYGKSIVAAKTSAQKAAMARRLMGVAAANDDDTGGSADRYALAALAKSIATDAGDVKLAFECLDRLNGWFLIDFPTLQSDTAQKLAKTATTPPSRKELAGKLLPMIDQAVLADRYDAARPLANAAIQAARGANDADLLKIVTARTADLAKIELAYKESVSAAAVLAKTPADPKANLAVGRFLCQFKGDWAGGLPKLALGDDATLKSLAQQELKPPGDAEAALAIADGWWDLAEKQPGAAGRQIRAHAVEKYSALSSRVTGLSRVKVDKRLADSAAEARAALAAGGDPAKPGANAKPAAGAKPLAEEKWVDLFASREKELASPPTARSTPDGVVLDGPKDKDCRLKTVKPLTVPFKAQFVAKPDSNNLRFHFAKGTVIFNWEVKSSELRIHDPVTGKPTAFKDKGSLIPNEWVTIDLTVAENYLEVSVNGEARGRIEGDYAGQSDILAIAAHHSIVTVSAFRVIEGK